MNDWFYRFGRVLLNQTVRLYYRRIEVIGRDRMPATGPAIIVANHPNSWADAFLLASQLTPRKLNFVAKDSITRAPVVGWILRGFGLVGVARAMDYRCQRDLARQRNQASIATCTPRLLAGGLIAIFGEGVSTDARRLQTIRKGAMRFGYAAELAAGFKLGLHWVPLGINYSAKQRFRSDVLIRVGQPFRLDDLLCPGETDPATHENAILQRGTQRLQRNLESLIIHIEREELAGLIDYLAELFGSPAGSLAARVERHQRIARAVQYFNVAEPQRLAEVERALRGYQRRLAAVELTDDVVRQRHATLTLRVSLLGMVKSGALMVLNLYGWANSFVPRWCALLFRPFGRRPSEAPGAGGQTPRLDVAKEALWGAVGGWLGAAVAFPLQTYLVFRWAAGARGMESGIALATLYGLSLIPSWRLYVRRRDILREHYANLRDAFRFLVNAAPATRLQHHRRQLLRRVRALLAE